MTYQISQLPSRLSKCHALSLQGSLKSEPSLFRSIFETISERKHLAGWFEESLQRLRSFPEVMRPCLIQGAMATDSEVSSRSLPGLGEELKVYNSCSTLFLICRTDDIRLKTGYCLSPWCKMGQVALLRQSKPSERKWSQVLVQTCYCGARFLTSTAFQWAELDGQQLVCRVLLAPTAGSKLQNSVLLQIVARWHLGSTWWKWMLLSLRIAPSLDTGLL